MALSETYQIKVLEIWGLPAAGNTLTVTSLVHWPFSNSLQWEATFNKGDITELITECRAKLAALTAESQLEVIPLVDRFDEIKYSPMRVTSAAGGAGGNLVDHKLERENIRQLIANLCGVAVPEGGFLAETQACYGKSVAQWAKGQGGIGDR